MKLLVVILLFIAVKAENTHQQKRTLSSNVPCPKKCMCFRRTVRCMKLGLTDIPTASTQTVLLDIRFNRIKEIKPEIFKNHKNIRSLLMNNNRIKELKSGAFKGLIQLKHLYIYKNYLKHIDADVFQGLLHLEYLYLQGNELKSFADGTFSNLPSLDRLFLYANKIHHISPEIFQNLPKLKRLRLDQNALECDCRVGHFAEMLHEKSVEVAANCKYPEKMYGKNIREMKMDDFHCIPPKITEDPKDIEITIGGTAIFTCKVQGDDETSIIWMKEDENIIDTNEKYDIMDNGTLLIKNTEKTDEGHYECMAKNRDGVAKSRTARMIVLDEYGRYNSYPRFEPVLYQRDGEFNNIESGPPKFTIRPASVTTTVGDPQIKLICKASGNPHLTYSWSKNGIQLAPSSRILIDENESSLTILNLQDGDDGTYSCEASNQYGSIRSEANIIFNVAPVFNVRPENKDLTVGETLKLECAALGFPRPQLSWYKGDFELRSNERISITSDGNYLEIKRVEERDSDTYTCKAKNDVGTIEYTAKVKISSTSRFKAPKLVYKPYHIEAIVGSTVEFPCKAEGDPAPGIQWTKDGSRMQVTGRTKVSLTGNFYIINIQPDDQGRYECTATNGYGSDTAYGYLTVKEDHDNKFTVKGSNVGDKFVKVAFAEATSEVDKAINNTINNLFSKKGHHNPGELFTLFRFPDAPTRELARAAEVYERTLEKIRKHVDDGQSMKATSDYNYREILSREHLELIASLSGCMTPRRIRNCSDMCFHSKYRSIDGTCNNLQNPTWGASLTGFRRVLKPVYEDGFAKPIGWDKERKYNGFKKPLSRLVSTTLIATDNITPDEEITHMVMQWGQFLDHDLDHAIPSVTSESWGGVDCKKTCDYAAPCYPMDIPPGDRRVTNRRCIDFIRSSAICGSGMTSVFFDEIQTREQINQLTSYIDASQVYGFSEELAKDLRDLNSDWGRLKEGVQFPDAKPLLPYVEGQGMDCRRNLSESEVQCFLAGDIRANEQSGLIAMHTLWMREHNRLAKELKYLNPHWDSDTLYHESRKIVGAVMQHITFKHWLPYIIGEEGMEKLGEYKGYDPNINPSISNVFATAALRFGHTLINPVLHRLDWKFEPIREGHLPLRHAFFSPWRVVNEGGIDPLLRGMFTVAAKMKKPTENLNTELTEQLFRTAHAVALDLAAMNVHRSRDHGIPGYTAFRKVCNMRQVHTFEDLQNEISDASVRAKLQQLYGHVDNIDVFVGGILEDPVPNGRVGPLFQCLLIEQFRRLRDGDRFYYENPSVFKPEQLVYIKQYTLAQVLCNNGDNITRITRNVFLQPDLQGGLIQCSELPKINLKLWSHCCSDCKYSGQLSTISRLNALRNRRDTQSVEKDTLNNNSTICSKYIVKSEEETKELKKKVSELEKEIKQIGKTLQKFKDML